MPACHAGDRRFESGRVRHPSPLLPYAPSARPDGAFLCSSSHRLARACANGSDPRDPHLRSGAAPGATPSRLPPPSCRASRMRAFAGLLLVTGAPAGDSPSSPSAALLAAAVPSPSRSRQAPSASPVASASAAIGRATRRRPQPRPPPPRRPAASPPPTAATRLPSADVADRPGDPVPVDRRATTRDEVEDRAGGRARRYDGARAGRGRRRRDPRRDRRRAAPTDAAPARCSSRDADDARGGPRRQSQAARVPARRRGRARRSAPWAGATDACSAWSASNARSTDWRPDRAAPADEAGLRPGGAWTLVAGGDILLDRGVAQTVKVERQGRRLPVRRRHGRDHRPLTCCSAFGWELPHTERTGNAGRCAT